MSCSNNSAPTAQQDEEVGCTCGEANKCENCYICLCGDGYGKCIGCGTDHCCMGGMCEKNLVKCNPNPKFNYYFGQCSQHST